MVSRAASASCGLAIFCSFGAKNWARCSQCSRSPPLNVEPGTYRYCSLSRITVRSIRTSRMPVPQCHRLSKVRSYAIRMRSAFAAIAASFRCHKVVQLYNIEQRRAVYIFAIREPGEGHTRKPASRLFHVMLPRSLTKRKKLFQGKILLSCTPVTQYRQTFTDGGAQIHFQHGLAHLV